MELAVTSSHHYVKYGFGMGTVKSDHVIKTLFPPLTPETVTGREWTMLALSKPKCPEHYVSRSTNLG